MRRLIIFCLTVILGLLNPIPSWGEGDGEMDFQVGESSPQAQSNETGGVSQAKAQEAQQAECKQAAATAENVCTVMGLYGGEMGMYMQMMLSQTTALTSQIASAGKDQNKQCKLQMKMNATQGALNTAHMTSCVATIYLCKSACGVPKEGEEAINATLAAKCGALAPHAVMAAMSALQSGAGYAQSLSCAKMTGGGIETPQIPEMPKITPVGCQEGSPDYESDDCKCLRDPKECVKTLGGGGPASYAGGTGSNGSTTPFMNGGEGGEPLNGKLVDQTPVEGKTSSGSNTAGGGGGGGPSGGGSGGGVGGEEGGPSGPQAAPDKNVITGVSNSGGGGGGSPGGYGKAGGGAARKGGIGGLLSRFNLKKFLPKGKNKSSLASAGAQDGITGANGPSLWEKVRGQYQNQKSRLLQGP